MKNLILLFFQIALFIIMQINVFIQNCVISMWFVCLYVDDMLIASNDMKGIIETKRFLSSTFKMKGLGQVDTILGI